MTTLITGGAGFIGHHLARRLLERGDDVVVVDNMNDHGVGTKEKWDNARRLENDGVGVVDSDIRDVSGLRRTFLEYGVGRVVHLAALAGVRHSRDHPYDYASVNLAGTTAVLEVSRDVVDNFVFASSSSVYGEREGVFAEEDALERQESFYGLTKRLDEDLARFFSDQYGLNTTGLRFFTVYGPRGRTDMAHRGFTEKLIRGEVIELFNRGRNVRDYTFVDDIVNGIVLALDNPHECEVYNLGGGEPVSTIDFYNVLTEGLGLDGEVELVGAAEGDVTRTCADTTKAEMELNFRREIGFEEGMARYCDWAREHYDIQ